MSRPFEKVTVEVKADDSNPDFGNKTLEWEQLCSGIHATIKEKTGRLTQSGSQMVPLFDEEIEIMYHRPTHEAWQKKRVLRIVDTVGDVYGVKSLKHTRGTRVPMLKLGCVRS